jgi:hypothetical protein
MLLFEKNSFSDLGILLYRTLMGIRGWVDGWCNGPPQKIQFCKELTFTWICSCYSTVQ